MLVQWLVLLVTREGIIRSWSFCRVGKGLEDKKVDKPFITSSIYGGVDFCLKPKELFFNGII